MLGRKNCPGEIFHMQTSSPKLQVLLLLGIGNPSVLSNFGIQLTDHPSAFPAVCGNGTQAEFSFPKVCDSVPSQNSHSFHLYTQVWEIITFVVCKIPLICFLWQQYTAIIAKATWPNDIFVVWIAVVNENVIHSVRTYKLVGSSQQSWKAEYKFRLYIAALNF